MLKNRFLLQNTKVVFPLRCFCEEKKQLSLRNSIQRREEKKELLNENVAFGGIQVQYWNELSAKKEQRKIHSEFRKINSYTDFLVCLQNLNNFPLTIRDFINYMKRRRVRLRLAEQEYLPKRVAVLGPDLAAAHFIYFRKGSVKFFGRPEWIGINKDKQTLPRTYVPGLFVEAINAEGTELCYEGLPNLQRLRYLTSLSLKNLKTINDWCLDWISKDHYLNLKHLDISGCVNVTYRGLSCFYRFECLETLNVEGIPDTPEFKVACLMLLDIMPELDIRGINLTIPEKIDAENEKKLLPDSGKEIQELTN